MNIQTFPRPSVTIMVTHAACILVGVLISWWLWHPKVTSTETAAPAIALQGGAEVIKRDPLAVTPAALTTATKQLGKGKLVRTISLDVAPNRTTDMPCAPVHVDLGIVKMPDESQRIITSSASGTITNAVDHPVMSLPIQRDLKWSAGVAYDVLNRKYGAFIDRDVGPFRFGVDVIRTADDRSFNAVARIGIRF